jgi:hypothetical protein
MEHVFVSRKKLSARYKKRIERNPRIKLYKKNKEIKRKIGKKGMNY